MKLLYLIIRLLTGVLFVFSGIVKLNDPSGFAIKLNEYFDVFSNDLSTIEPFLQYLKNYSIILSGSFCALEVLLGIAMILGWQMKITLSVTSILIVFFTFLTGYSAFYNKVTDCGCFGDFIHLDPWVSFKKDLILVLFVAILLLHNKQNKAIFKLKNANVLMFFSMILTTTFGLYCYFYLPVWDFLPYKKGNDIDFIMNHIPDGERATDSVEIRFVMRKGADSCKATTIEYADFIRKGYEFVRQDRKVIVEGYKNPIHDFAIHDLEKGIDYKDSFLKYDGFQILFISPFLSEISASGLSDISKLYDYANQNKRLKFYALTSASSEAALNFTKGYNLGFKFFAADQKMLMTMARYNPTIYLFEGSTVIDKWSGQYVPSVEDLKKYLNQ